MAYTVQRELRGRTCKGGCPGRGVLVEQCGVHLDTENTEPQIKTPNAEFRETFVTHHTIYFQVISLPNTKIALLRKGIQVH